MATAAEVLLKLLDHADGAELVVLLDAENLLVVLTHAGRTRDEIKAALARGKLPGELLLEVFSSGRKKDELLASLGESGARQLAAERAGNKPSPAKGTVHRAPQRGVTGTPAFVLDGKGKIGVALLFLGAFLPPLFGFLDLRVALWLWTSLGAVAVGVAALGGIGGGLLAIGREKLWVGIVCGALASVGGAAAAIWYLIAGPGAGRASVMRLEIVLAAIVGMIPGAIVLRVLRALTR